LVLTTYLNIMEILGLVWAASIVNPSISLATTATMAGQEPPSPQPISKGIALGMTGLARTHGWDADYLAPTVAYSTYASTTSWLVPDLSQANLTLMDGPLSTAVFSPLSSVIGTRLTSLEPPIAEVPAVAEGNALLTSGSWHGWDAIAAVHIVAPGETDTAEDITLGLDSQCVAESSVEYQASPIAMKASPKFQVWVNNHFIGEVSGRAAAQRVADKFRLLIREGELDPDQLTPLFGSNFVGGSLHSDILFVVDETMRSHPEVPAAAIAVQWINNLRIAFDAQPLDQAQVHMAMVGLAETPESLYGTASWYGPGFHGRKTANGERFNQYALTAAHKTLPFNTHLKVTNRLNGKSVVVRINDRGPYIGDRSLDLSKAAAHCLGSTGRGVIPYEAVLLEPVNHPHLDELTTAKLD